MPVATPSWPLRFRRFGSLDFSSGPDLCCPGSHPDAVGECSFTAKTYDLPAALWDGFKEGQKNVAGVRNSGNRTLMWFWCAWPRSMTEGFFFLVFIHMWFCVYVMLGSWVKDSTTTSLSYVICLIVQAAFFFPFIHCLRSPVFCAIIRMQPLCML